MNYRHQFHAGNFADVMKHALLVRLVRDLQRKEKGFLYLDTHAGRGTYDLASAARGDSLARQPEWPAGIGRLLDRAPAAPVGLAATAPESAAHRALDDYVQLVRAFDRERGHTGSAAGYYPGSPELVARLARPQDRLVLCEAVPDERSALADALSGRPRVTVPESDGYAAVRAWLPPPERRALVLIDPPYEAQDEFTRVVRAIDEGLMRLASAVFAVWYPLTARARLDAFFGELADLRLPATLKLELSVADETVDLKLRGCGVVVVNPPWRFDATATPMLHSLAARLAQGPGAEARTEWVVPER